MKIIDRLRRLERHFLGAARSLFLPDQDGFISALVGVDRKHLCEREGGYDVMAALNLTAAEDWAEEII